MSYIDNKLSIPKGLIKHLYFDKLGKNLYTVKITNPNPTSLEDWYITLDKIEARNKNKAKEVFIDKIKTDKQLNKKVKDIMNQLQEKEREAVLERLRKRVKEGKITSLWQYPTNILKRFLKEEGFDTKDMTRDEMEELIIYLATKKEPVYLTHTERFEELTQEGTKIIYEKRTYSDGSTRIVKIKELLNNWEVTRNKEGIIEQLTTELELVSGAWRISLSGLDEHPDIIDDREKLINLLKKAVDTLYIEGKEPISVGFSGGKKPLEREIKTWTITARKLPETEGGGRKPKLISPIS